MEWCLWNVSYLLCHFNDDHIPSVVPLKKMLLWLRRECSYKKSHLQVSRSALCLQNWIPRISSQTSLWRNQSGTNSNSFAAYKICHKHINCSIFNRKAYSFISLYMYSLYWSLPVPSLHCSRVDRTCCNLLGALRKLLAVLLAASDGGFCHNNVSCHYCT